MSASATPASSIGEEALDPQDWSALADLAHRIVEDSVAYLRDTRQRPAWQDMPAQVKSFFEEPPPDEGLPPDKIYDDLVHNLMPYPMGNVHPRFWAWFMGAGNAGGALADFLAAIQGSNLGGGNHAAVLLDRQVVRWLRTMVGFPSSASGLLVSGGSVANLMGLSVARHVKAGVDVRELGVQAIEKPLRFYGSDQMHSCIRKAVETLGLGNQSLRRVPAGPDFRMDVCALRSAIAEDRAAGLEPACIIANAGTVNTGAIDELGALADLASQEGLWLHVDGCIGALLAIAPRHRHLVAGLERADSLALDPHKWLHAPFDVGCVLIKDASAHRAAFAVTPEYLETTPRGLPSGPWLHELGLQTSQGFRALKVWMALREHGIRKFGRLIDQNIEQAAYLQALIEQHAGLEMVAPATINIVCFRFNPGGLGDASLRELNIEIMLRLQEEGTAVVSDTTIHGKHCLRVAICNHRTKRQDIRLLIEAVSRIGRTLQNCMEAGLLSESDH